MFVSWHLLLFWGGMGLFLFTPAVALLGGVTGAVSRTAALTVIVLKDGSKVRGSSFAFNYSTQ